QDGWQIAPTRRLHATGHRRANVFGEHGHPRPMQDLEPKPIAFEGDEPATDGEPRGQTVTTQVTFATRASGPLQDLTERKPGPADRPRPMPRGAPRVEAPPRRAPGDHVGPLVAAVPPEAHGETGARAARRLHRGLLRIPPERHDGGREPVPRDRAEHLRAAL